MITDKILMYALGAALIGWGITAGVLTWQKRGLEVELAQAQQNYVVAKANTTTLELAVKSSNDKVEAMKKDRDRANANAKALVATSIEQGKEINRLIADLRSRVRPQGVDACTFADQLMNEEIDRRIAK